MSTQRINEIVEYIYGEMDPPAQAAFERKLNGDPSLKEEVDALLSVKTSLSAMHDEQHIDHTPDSGPADRLHTNGTSWIKPILAVAASLALLLFAGYATRFQLRYSGDGLYIGFHANAQQMTLSDAALDNEEYENVREIFRNETMVLHDKMEQMEQRLNHLADAPVNEGALSEQVISRIEANNESHIRELVQYINDRDVKQRDFVQDLLSQYASYVQQQREEDLLAIGESIGGLRQSQVQQKYATEQLLSGLMTATNYE